MNTEQLLKRIYGQSVTIKETIPMEKGASSRSYFRLEMSTDVNPSRLVLMALPEDAMKADEVTAGGIPDELPFINVQRYMAEAGLPVPKIYLDAVEHGAVFLEDLGKETFVKRIRGKSEDVLERWYMAAVDLMARMHKAMWPVPQGCQANQRYFDFDLLRWELDHYREWGAEIHGGGPLEEDLRKRLDEVFDSFAREIADMPKGFVHRDYQSRNLMITGKEPSMDNLSIIDFQDALIGPRVYDLVALLNDSYVDVPEDMQQRIIERYAVQTGLSAVDVRNEFDLITVQRKLKDGARFIFIDRVKKDPSFLPFVDKSFGRVKKALKRLSGHESLKEILAQVDPFRFA